MKLERPSLGYMRAEFPVCFFGPDFIADEAEPARYPVNMHIDREKIAARGPHQRHVGGFHANSLVLG